MKVRKIEKTNYFLPIQYDFGHISQLTILRGYKNTYVTSGYYEGSLTSEKLAWVLMLMFLNESETKL
jgi:hypothetical protein